MASPPCGCVEAPKPARLRRIGPVIIGGRRGFREGPRRGQLIFYQCPEPEVRAQSAASPIANFGFKGALALMELLVSLDSEVRMRTCRECLRTSELGH